MLIHEHMCTNLHICSYAFMQAWGTWTLVYKVCTQSELEFSHGPHSCGCGHFMELQLRRQNVLIYIAVVNLAIWGLQGNNLLWSIYQSNVPYIV